MDLKCVPIPDDISERLFIFAQCPLGLLQLSLGVLPLILHNKDKVIAAPHHLIGLFELILTVAEVLHILCCCLDSLRMLHAHPVQLLLHVSKF